MPTGTWPLSWATGDLMQAAEFKKGIGSLFDSTLGAPAANVDATGIVATYAHLLVVIYTRGTTATGTAPLTVRFNNDSAANYDSQLLRGVGAAAAAVESFAQTSAQFSIIPDSTAGANLFGAQVAFIPHYAGTASNKLCLSLSSVKSGTGASSMQVNLYGAFWRSSAAINRITVLPVSGNLATGTRVSIYGMGA